MLSGKINNIVNYIILGVVCIVVTIGAIGLYRDLIMFLGLALGVAAIGYKLTVNGKIDIPKHFYIYIIFLVILLIHSLVKNGNMSFWWLFVSGAVFWLFSYNFKNVFFEYLNQGIVSFGLLMGILYFYTLFNPVNLPSLATAFAPANDIVKHSNIGDIWAVILVGIIYKVSKQKSIFNFALIIIGSYFLIVSYSRSAVLALILGLLFMFSESRESIFFQKYSRYFLIILCFIFMYISLTKTVLFSRPYFLQALQGLLKFPLGAGLGNFGAVSPETNLVHNIVLEIVSALGVFSLVFIFWLIRVIVPIFKTREINVEAAAIFLTILINFSFNTTYVIPSFVWIWFIALALIY